MFRVTNIKENLTTDYSEKDFITFTKKVIDENGDNKMLDVEKLTLTGCFNYITNFCDNLEVEDRRFDINEFLRMQSIIEEKISDFAKALKTIYGIYEDYEDYDIEDKEITLNFESYSCGDTNYEYKTIPITDLELSLEDFTKIYTEIKRKADEKAKRKREEAKRKREEAERLEVIKRKKEREEEEFAIYERVKKKIENS
jgi:hypothetical protein